MILTPKPGAHTTCAVFLKGEEEMAKVLGPLKPGPNWRISPCRGKGGLGRPEVDVTGGSFSSLPLAHLYFIIKHLLPHHIALAISRDDVQQPGNERSVKKVSAQLR